ncbi:hypothetical protein D3C81_1037380 [compost metagenome]
MAVAVNQYRATGRRRIHSDYLVGGGGAVGHQITLLGVKGTGNILFGFQMWTGVIQQRSQFCHRDRDICF